MQNAILDGEKAVFQKLSTLPGASSSVDRIVVGYLSTLSNLGDHVEQTRTKAAEAMLSLAAFARRDSELQTALASVIVRAREDERSHSVLQVLQQAESRMEERRD